MVMQFEERDEPKQGDPFDEEVLLSGQCRLGRECKRRCGGNTAHQHPSARRFTVAWHVTRFVDAAIPITLSVVSGDPSDIF
jgi:hypothetical protein